MDVEAIKLKILSRAGSELQQLAPAPSVQDITDECVAQHNKFRQLQLNGTFPTLKANDHGRELIKKIVESRTVNGTCVGGHSKASEREGMGENIYGVAPANAECRHAVAAWYNEIKNWPNTYPGPNWYDAKSYVKIGHFVGMFWDEVDSIACAVQRNCPEKEFNRIYCLYSPRNNKVGRAPFSEDQHKALIKRYESGVDIPSSKPDTPPTESEKPPPTESEKPPPTESEKPPPTESEKPPPTESEKPPPTESEKPPPTESEKPPPPPSEPYVEDVTEECIFEHDRYRQVGMKGLYRMLTASERARELVKNVVKSKIVNGNCLSDHSPGVDRAYMGESIFVSNGPAKCQAALQLWYSEIKGWPVQYPGRDWYSKRKGCVNRFVSIFWGLVRSIGCAAQRNCPNGKSNALYCLYTPGPGLIGREPFSEQQHNAVMNRHKSGKNILEMPYPEPGRMGPSPSEMMQSSEPEIEDPSAAKLMAPFDPII